LLRRISPDSWLAIGLFVVLGLVTAVSIYQQTQEQPAPPLTSFSNQPDGAHALWQWLGKLGYTTTDLVSDSFRIPDDTDIILIFEPTVFMADSEWVLFDEWVEAGGTLIIAGDGFFANNAFAHYDFSLNFQAVPVNRAIAQTPLMASPPAATPALANTEISLQTNRDDFVTHFALANDPAVVSFGQGNGRIILSTITYPFTNKGLQDEGNPAFALNLISAAGQKGKVWFDEWHHGVRVDSQEVAGFGSWLQRTPVGQSFLLMAAVVFVAMVLRGRRFGRPVPLPNEISRRAPLEYITALANLSRRAGHRQAVLQDYRQRLKKHIGQRYHLDPATPDEEFMARLAAYNPSYDLSDLRILLKKLASTAVSEADLVQTTAEVSDWLNK
jgi:hypothetical protein